MPDFSVRMIPIADLRDHPRNSNRHGDRQLEVLATRWRALGWYKNVVVAEWEGTTTLLAGHGIVAGARAAGATEAPCHVREIDPLSPEALDILEGDNTVADLAEPDLHERLRNLVELDAAGRLGNVGYDDGALDRLKAELQAEEFAAGQGPLVEDPGPSEPPIEPVTKLGDVWLMGEHRLVCGDCTNAAVVEAVTQGRRFSLVFTDPPYGVNYDGGSGNESQREALHGDDGDAYAAAMPTLPVTGDAACYLWFAGKCGRQVYAAAEECGWTVRALLVWNKLNPHYGGYLAQYMQKHEPCLYLVRGVAPWYGPTNEVTVWDVEQPSRNEWHPTQKPIELAVRAMQNSSAAGDGVFDGFLGSGTTLIAAEQLGRVCYGIEIEPRYVDVAVRRWQQATGQTAILESTGQPFPDVT